jgi:hypothetical protein
MNSTRTLVDKLVSLGATLRKPASEDQIIGVESRLQCRFPNGVREFYRTCDGVDDATSEWIWDFFSLRTLLDRTAQRRASTYLTLDNGDTLPYADLVCFCDVLIDAPTYLFCANPANQWFGAFFADQGYDGWKVADTYENFVNTFVLRNDDVLMMPINE